MSLRFRRRYGAAADVSELEYVIALHQTCSKVRENATVSSRDVLRLLRSRYRLDITHRRALDVVRSFAGGTGHAVVDPVEQERSERRKRKKMRKRQKGRCGHACDDAEDDVEDGRGGSSSTMKSSIKAAEKGISAVVPSAFATSSNTLRQQQYPHRRIDYSGDSRYPQQRLYEEGDRYGYYSNGDAGERPHHQAYARRPPQRPQSPLLASPTAYRNGGADVADTDNKGATVPTAATTTNNNDDDEDVPSEFLDLVQVLSVLLIPTMARVADEHANGVRPAPFVEEIPVPYRFLGLFTSPVDRWNRWRADRQYARYERQRPKPNDVLPAEIRRCWLDKLEQNMDSFRGSHQFGSTATHGSAARGGEDSYFYDQSASSSSYSHPHESRQSELSPVVDDELVRTLLLAFGEFERAQDRLLIRQMAEVSCGTDAHANVTCTNFAHTKLTQTLPSFEGGAVKIGEVRRGGRR